MTILSNNTDLYNYLIVLANKLKRLGADNLSQLVVRATRAAGQSTEFLGESKLSLQQVLQDGNKILTSEEYKEMQIILAEINNALR